MIAVKLERSDGNFIEINLPETTRELTLSQKLDIDFANFGLISFLKKHEANLFNVRGQYLLQLAKGLSDTLEIDFGVIMNLKGQSLLELTPDEFINHIETLSGQVKGLNKNQLESNLLTIWNHLCNVASLPVDESAQIVYKGHTYELPKVAKDAISGKPIHEDITVQRAVEIIQVNNNYSKWENEQGSEDHKNTLFTKMVSEIALMLDPNMPTDETEAMAWLSERVLYFQDIDWNSAKVIEMWINSYMDTLKANPENRYFFESAHKASTPEEREAQAKGEGEAKKIYANVGIKSIYATLLELNPFQKSGESKIESIKKAKYSEAVKILSLHNSKQ